MKKNIKKVLQGWGQLIVGFAAFIYIIIKYNFKIDPIVYMIFGIYFISAGVHRLKKLKKEN
ncbi:MAG: hypothetical protein FXF54_14565 [Kosmotoga sp.]|nr:MAG: hypothetical protein FXF54_14565 [Kosmotoga sp.]